MGEDELFDRCRGPLIVDIPGLKVLNGACIQKHENGMDDGADIEEGNRQDRFNSPIF